VDDLMVNGVALPQPEFSGLLGFCAEPAGALGVYCYMLGLPFDGCKVY
jgi:hypothetical protein